jgi:hypothetical protein
LWSGSSKGFRESILPSPDPGQNYAKFMDDYTAKKHEGYNVTLDEVNETTTTLLDHNSHEETGLPISNIPNVTSDDEMNESTTTVLDHNSREETGILNPNIPNAKALRDGFKFYNIPQCLFADLILSFQDHKSSQIFFQSIDWKNAFQVVAVELGLMYDMLHTKAAVTSKRILIGLKATSVLCTILALFTFSIFRPKPINSDHIITFVLFGGAIFLEIYAAIVLFSSSRAMLWFSNHNNRGAILFYKFISWFQFYFWISHTVTWSNLMSQFNLFRFCLKAEPVKCIKIQKFFHIYNFFEKSYYQKTKQVSEELKELIFNHLKDKSEEAKDIEACKKLCAHKGDWVLEKGNCHICKQNCRIHNEQNSHIQDEKNCHICDINRSIKEVEFDESILLWHIATDLCYSSDDINCQGLNLVALQSREESQLLSDYMLNLLVICPFLLPNGIGEIRFQDTCAEVDELLKERKYIKDRSKVCKMILRVNTAIPPSQVKGDRSKSVLFDACRLAKSLQSLETEENWSKEKKWDMISNVWVEMLCHVASQCRGLNHAKQLSQGGELLTHVWLLMAHFGITEQFQISKGHVRVKLKLS